MMFSSRRKKRKAVAKAKTEAATTKKKSKKKKTKAKGKPRHDELTESEQLEVLANGIDECAAS